MTPDEGLTGSAVTTSTRRSILRLSGVALGVGSAGCIDVPVRGNGSDDSINDDIADQTDDQDTDDMNDATSDGNTIRDVHFAVIDVTGSDYELEATATFEDDRVAISGTISGNNSCYTARIGAVGVVDDSVTVDIESFDDAAADEVCLEVLVGISYEVAIIFDGDTPERAIVRHNGEVVTEVSQN